MAVRSGPAGVYRSASSGLYTLSFWPWPRLSFLTRPRCPELPWRDARGAGPSEREASLLLQALSAFCGWWSGARERPEGSGWNQIPGFNQGQCAA